MWSRLGRGWSMARASMCVLRRDPKLMILPLISASAFAVVIGLAVASLLPQLAFIHSGADRIWAWLGQAGSGQMLFFVLLFAVAYVLIATAIFCNVALIACALRSLQGERPSLRAGIATATARLPQI